MAPPRKGRWPFNLPLARTLPCAPVVKQLGRESPACSGIKQKERQKMKKMKNQHIILPRVTKKRFSEEIKKIISFANERLKERGIDYFFSVSINEGADITGDGFSHVTNGHCRRDLKEAKIALWTKFDELVALSRRR